VPDGALHIQCVAVSAVGINKDWKSDPLPDRGHRFTHFREADESDIRGTQPGIRDACPGKVARTFLTKKCRTLLNACKRSGTRLEVIWVHPKGTLRERRIPQLTFGQGFGQQAGQKAVSFIRVNKGVDEVVKPHVAQRYPFDWHGSPNKPPDGKIILA
jgi:hypothetical protein